jgi:hypothetical protein
MKKIFSSAFSVLALIPLIIYAWWPEAEDVK